MTTQITQQTWGFRSVSYWLTLCLALGIIFIGVRFILLPDTGAAGYGISFIDAHDAAYGRVKGIRDIFSGLALLPLLIMRMRKAVAYVFTATIIIPIADFLIVWMTNGPGDTEHLMVHGITAIVMIANSLLLFRRQP